MSLLAIPFPAIDPVLVSFGPVAIRWYSLAYIVGFVLGWWLIRRQLAHPPQLFPKQALDDLLIWVVIGVVLGGRLGYVLFYHPLYFAHHPLEIFQLWQGGMSFHGGMIGSIAGVFAFCRIQTAEKPLLNLVVLSIPRLQWRRPPIPFLPVMDLVALVAPIGLGLGRLANFINGELYGRVSDVPWAMVFPHGGPEPRHPSQLYQAFGEGLLLLLLLWIACRLGGRRYPGLIGGLFLSGYAIARMVGEYFRQPDAHLGLLVAGLTMGQLLSIPMLLLGLYVIRRALSQRLESPV